MNRKQQMEERLWDLIDGLAGAEERSMVEDLIAGDREWQLKYEELLDLHRAMTNAELEVPSLRFSRNVMEEIAKHKIAPATNSYLSGKVIRSIAAFFAITIAGALIYMFTQLKGLESPSSPAPSSNDHPLQDQLRDQLNKFDWGRIFNNTFVNVFILVNLILGLMLLDMYLTRKRRSITPS